MLACKAGNLDAAWYAGLAANEAGAFEIEDHLVY
jgi:hypothetical protein